jgi:hypothetical protein
MASSMVASVMTVARTAKVMNLPGGVAFVRMGSEMLL